jgi:dihydrofolate synthase/folylpolyglutamate synthase
MHFFAQNCEVILLETGLGGAEDATNVVGRPILTVLTSIGLDHCKELGDTAEAIAESECGILKSGVPLITVRHNNNIMQVIERLCDINKSPLIVVNDGVMSHITHRKRQNLLLAMAVAKSFGVNESIIKRYLGSGEPCCDTAFEEVEWFGRFTILGENSPFILDGAHNPSAMEWLRLSLMERYPNQRFNFIVGVYRDKDICGMLHHIKDLAQQILTVDVKGNSRLYVATELADIAKNYCSIVTAVGNISDAVRIALRGNLPTVVCGSLSIIYEANEAYENLTV